MTTTYPYLPSLLDGWIVKTQPMMVSSDLKLLKHQREVLEEFSQIAPYGKPIEIAPLESFSVKINYPTAYWTFNAEELVKLLSYPQMCDCSTQMLMRSGCVCGGE